MRSCATHRLAEIAVGLAILLLVALLAVLWSGSSGAASVVERPGNATHSQPQQPPFARDLLQIMRRDERKSPFILTDFYPSYLFERRLDLTRFIFALE